MPDQLRERFDALRTAVGTTEPGGLHDVRQRRTRRARAKVAAGSAFAVVVLAVGGVLVLPQLGTESSDTTAAEVLDATAGQADSDRAGSTEPDAPQTAAPTAGPTEAAPTEEVTTEVPPSGQPPSEGPPDDNPPSGPFSLSQASLLTWAEIQGVGETGPGTTPYEASLVFPPLCAAGSSPEQYSAPDAYFSAEWTVSDGRLSQSVVEYASDQAAADALARLVRDSQACPVFNEFATIIYNGTDASVGAEIAFFDLALESGEDGSIHTAVISVTRVANVLVEFALVPDGPDVANAGSRSRALAGAAVTKIEQAG